MKRQKSVVLAVIIPVVKLRGELPAGFHQRVTWSLLERRLTLLERLTVDSITAKNIMMY
jgi:hypothetical protein